MLFILLSVFILSIISVHGTEDLANDCIEALNAGSITGMCVKAAQLKWNLDSLNSATATQASCCAMYEALNCLQKSSCNVCPQKDLHDTAQYRIRALLALGETLCRDTPYNASAERCKVGTAEITPMVPLQQHCENELQSSTEASSFKGALILGLVMLAILIFVAVLGLVIHLMARNTEEGGELKVAKQRVPDRRSGSGTFKLHRTQTFSSGRFLPVRRVTKGADGGPKQTSSAAKIHPFVVVKKQTSAKRESSSKSKKSIKEKPSSSSSRPGKLLSLTKLPSKVSSISSTSAKPKDVKK